ncbi:MAG: transcriptional regulator GcvA [Dehalococcoidia bacterium]
MSRRPPSLKALRAFEVVARHLSMAKAAAELNVSPGAVGYQIRALEADLGIKLVHRGDGGLTLTEGALAIIPELRRGFESVFGAVERLRHADHHHRLSLTVGASFGIGWLSPRLSLFNRCHPDVEIWLNINDSVADLRHEGFDAAIRFGGGNYAGLEAVPLFDAPLYPVCAPSLLRDSPPLDAPGELARHRLLHVDWKYQNFYFSTTREWERWFQQAGISGIDVTGGPRFSHVAPALAAAIDGYGVVLCSPYLVAQELAEGRLVCPFEIGLPIDQAYYLVYPVEDSSLHRVRVFRDWITEQARQADLLSSAMWRRAIPV